MIIITEDGNTAVKAEHICSISTCDVDAAESGEEYGQYGKYYVYATMMNNDCINLTNPHSPDVTQWLFDYLVGQLDGMDAVSKYKVDLGRMVRLAMEMIEHGKDGDNEEP